jgi:hypothetical protein
MGIFPNKHCNFIDIDDQMGDQTFYLVLRVSEGTS